MNGRSASSINARNRAKLLRCLWAIWSFRADHWAIVAEGDKCKGIAQLLVTCGESIGCVPKSTSAPEAVRTNSNSGSPEHGSPGQASKCNERAVACREDEQPNLGRERNRA